jgi:hypothetical protein
MVSGSGLELSMSHYLSALALFAMLVSAPAGGQTIVAAQPYTSNVDGFIVTEGDIIDRPYVEIGAVGAKAGKTTWISGNPNRERVDLKLREKARKMGAQAIVKVRYSSTGVSAMSWGGMRADGIAIRFTGPTNAGK